MDVQGAMRMRVLATALSIAFIGAGLVSAVMRFEESWGGSYGTIFLALGVLALAAGALTATTLASGLRSRNRVTLAGAVGISLATAAVLVVLGIAAGLRG
jgi:hypothetical protein